MNRRTSFLTAQNLNSYGLFLERRKVLFINDLMFMNPIFKQKCEGGCCLFRFGDRFGLPEK